MVQQLDKKNQKGTNHMYILYLNSYITQFVYSLHDLVAC